MPIRSCCAGGALMLALAATGTPAFAASFVMSSTSATDGASASVGASSHSSNRSSDASSPRRPLAQGEYRVQQVAQVAPGVQAVTLAATDGAPTRITLRLADRVVADGALAVGQRIKAHDRPYGMELARADTRQAFFLLLDDDWARELKTVPLGS
jgi:hypothetical protein